MPQSLHVVQQALAARLEEHLAEQVTEQANIPAHRCRHLLAVGIPPCGQAVGVPPHDASVATAPEPPGRAARGAGSTGRGHDGRRGAGSTGAGSTGAGATGAGARRPAQDGSVLLRFRHERGEEHRHADEEDQLRFTIKTRPEHTTWAQIRDVWLAADKISLFESGWARPRPGRDHVLGQCPY
jgi:hypothetical protein